MRTGERRHAGGYSYLLLLFALALGGAALAAIGTRWQAAVQREREAELVFRGLQIRDALQRYVAQTPAGQPAVPPQTLQQLLSDTRDQQPRHWLRRLYADPFTGQADWQLLRDAQGGIVGVASRSERPAMRRHAIPAEMAESAASPPRVGDWQFRADPARQKNDPRSPT